MSVFAWLALPVIALLLAMLWATWASRTRPPADPHDTVGEHERFRAALDPNRHHPDRRDRRRSEPPAADD